MMTSGMALALMGFIAGCAALAIIWAVVATVQRNSALRAEKQRSKLMAEIGALCAEVDNAINDYKLGTLDLTAAREAVRPRLQQTNTRLKTNMKQVDAYFVKYVEQFIDDRLAKLVQEPKPAGVPSGTDRGGEGEAILTAEPEKTVPGPQVEPLDESAKRTTPMPAIGTAGAESALAEQEHKVEEAPAGPPPSFEAQSYAQQAEVAPPQPPPQPQAPEAVEPAPAIEEETAAPPQPEHYAEAPESEIDLDNVSPDLAVTQVLERAAPPPITTRDEPVKAPAEEPPAFEPPAAAKEPAVEPALAEPQAADIEEVDIPVSNTFVPIEESGYLDDDVPQAGADTASAVAEQTPDVAEFEVPAGTGISDTISVPGESIEEDVEKTEAFDRESLAEVMSSYETGKTEGEGLAAGADVLTPEDDKEGESFIFGAPPATEEVQKPPAEVEAPAEAQAPAPEAPPAEKQDEEVLEVTDAREEESDDDELITGEDVVRKLDNLFGFNK